MFLSGERELNEDGHYALGWSKMSLSGERERERELGEKGCKSMAFLKGAR